MNKMDCDIFQQWRCYQDQTDSSLYCKICQIQIELENQKSEKGITHIQSIQHTTNLLSCALKYLNFNNKEPSKQVQTCSEEPSKQVPTCSKEPSKQVPICPKEPSKQVPNCSKEPSKQLPTCPKEPQKQLPTCSKIIESKPIESSQALHAKVDSSNLSIQKLKFFLKFLGDLVVQNHHIPLLILLILNRLKITLNDLNNINFQDLCQEQFTLRRIVREKYVEKFVQNDKSLQKFCQLLKKLGIIDEQQTFQKQISYSICRNRFRFKQLKQSICEQSTDKEYKLYIKNSLTLNIIKSAIISEDFFEFAEKMIISKQKQTKKEEKSDDQDDKISQQQKSDVQLGSKESQFQSSQQESEFQTKQQYQQLYYRNKNIQKNKLKKFRKTNQKQKKKEVLILNKVIVKKGSDIKKKNHQQQIKIVPKQKQGEEIITLDD